MATPLLALAALSMSAAPPIAGKLETDHAHSIPRATVDDTLEVEGQAVKARQVDTRMTVGVTVNGRGPFRFMVDSGADRSAIGVGVARTLALPAGRSVILHGVAGSSRVGTVRLQQLRVGGSVSSGLSVPVLPEAHLGAEGLLGIDALAGQRLMFDFDAKTITVQDTRRPPPRAKGDEIVITARLRKGQLIMTEASIGRGDVHAVVDSGAEITIGNMALRRALFRRGRRGLEPRTTTLVGVTGETIEAEIIVVPEMRLGGMTLRNLTMAFVDAPPFALFGLANQPAMLLGTDVLGAFRRVSLDFRNRRIRFRLRT